MLSAKHIGAGNGIPLRVKRLKFQTETLPRFSGILHERLHISLALFVMDLCFNFDAVWRSVD